MKIQDRVNEQATKLRESGSNEEKIECLEKLEKMFGDFGQKGKQATALIESDFLVIATQILDLDLIETNKKLKTSTIRILNNIVVSSTPSQLQMMLELGMSTLLRKHLCGPMDMQQDVIWTFDNMILDLGPVRLRVLQDGFIDRLVEILTNISLMPEEFLILCSSVLSHLTLDDAGGGSLPFTEVGITKLVSILGKIINFTKNLACLQTCITVLTKLTSGTFVASYTIQVVMNCDTMLLSNLVTISSTTGPLQELALGSLQTITTIAKSNEFTGVFGEAPHFLSTLKKVLCDKTVHSKITTIACDILASICSKGSSEVLSDVLQEHGLLSAVIELVNIDSAVLEQANIDSAAVVVEQANIDSAVVVEPANIELRRRPFAVKRAALYCIFNFFHASTAEQALHFITTCYEPDHTDGLLPIMDLLKSEKVKLKRYTQLVVKALEVVRVILGKNFATVADWDMVAVMMEATDFWQTLITWREVDNTNEDIRSAALLIDKDELRSAMVAKVSLRGGGGCEGSGSKSSSK